VTRDDSLTIVGMICAHWPGKQWTTESIAAYARAIEPLDAETTTRAVLRAVQELEHYPKVATLREFVRIEKRLSEPDPIRSQLDNTPMKIMPPWVRGWALSRVKYNDFRVWPEQDHSSDDPMPLEEREQYMKEGLEIPTSALFKAILMEIE